MADDLLRESSERVETLLQRFDAFPPATGARTDAGELVRIISALYGEALARIGRTLREQLGDSAQGVLEQCCSDPLVASLMIAHGLHPVPLEERVRRAIDSVRPYMQSHKGDVEILSIDEDVVELRLHGTCDGCASSQATLKLNVERAIFAAAPEILEVRADGAVASVPEILPSVSRWSEVSAPADMRAAEVRSVHVDDVGVLLMRDAGTWYAYRDRCPICLDAVRSPQLVWPLLSCGACGHSFDVVHAGRSPQNGSALEPLPLSGDDERLRIAVPVGA